MVKPNVPMLCWLVLLVGASGCAHYQYELLQPPVAGPRILSDKTATLVPLPFLEYRFSQGDDHLSMQITNTSDELITLVGPRSYVVDTVGQSHPLASRTIALHSYIALLIPPEPPEYRVYYPPGWYGYYPYSYYRPWGDYYWDYPPGPAYVTLATPTDYYWEWPGTGEFRLNLTFQRPQVRQAFTNTFLFARRKL
jgi:hypothetical protein